MDTAAVIDDYMSRQDLRVDLGCGANKQPGFLGIDVEALPGVDIVHDLEVYPWPLPTGSVGLLVASHIVEHIDPRARGFVRWMDEAWRVCRPGGTLMIATPYAGSPGYWADPTHINGCTELTFTYFDPAVGAATVGIRGYAYGVYGPKPWRIAHMSWDLVGQLEVSLVKREEDEVGEACGQDQDAEG